MWIARRIEARIKHSARTRPVIVLTGARQTGKTSTLLRLFPNYGFLSLDLPSEAEEAEKDPRSFLERHRPPIMIDEVQYAPTLFRYLKAEVDAHRDKNRQFLLTGSQKFSLMKNVTESLAGRADIVELETLLLTEIRDALPATKVETAIVRGGFPELYANTDIDAVPFYNSYLATYLERDVRALANVGSLRDFHFCATARQGAAGGEGWEPVLLARPDARGGLCRRSGWKPGVIRSEMDRVAGQSRYGESGTRAQSSREECSRRCGRRSHVEQLSILKWISGDPGHGDLRAPLDGCKGT
jgi:hypothetical protein